jgi:hypothetical protein
MNEPRSRLDEISTRWSLVNDPVQFVMRYAPAVRSYLRALVGSADDAEEVLQTFLVDMLTHCYRRAQTDKGRFRYYLKQSVRNSARAFFRRRPKDAGAAIDWEQIPDDGAEIDSQWADQWRQCILDRAWTALDAHQHRSPGNLFYTALQLRTQHPDDDSTQLASRAAEAVGRPLRVEAFDKQVSRARRMFARLVLKEVVETLERPTAVDVEEELIELGLLEPLRDFLPADWRTSLVLL